MNHSKDFNSCNESTCNVDGRQPPPPSSFHSPNRVGTKKPQHSHSKQKGRKPRNTNTNNPETKIPADMTVLLNRVDLLDGAAAAKAALREEAAYRHQVLKSKHDNNNNNDDDKELVPWVSPEEEEEKEAGKIDQQHKFSQVASYHFYGKAQSDEYYLYNAEEEEEQQQQHVITVLRVPHGKKNHIRNQQYHPDHHIDFLTNDPVMDQYTPNPNPVAIHDKYWAQRRRLFSRFDNGAMLDSEGWYSVTPEVIADHVAARLADLAPPLLRERMLRQSLGILGGNKQNGGGLGALFGNSSNNSNNADGLVVLDAFCGCGGNAIAFGKLADSLIKTVVCVDIDRNKLRMAAHNASLYNISTSKLIFIECNILHVMDMCYPNGELAMKRHAAMGPSALFERHKGFLIGGIELLPPTFDVVFMDPPWGGMDYNSLGKSGYDLHKHMKIRFGNVDSSTSVIANEVEHFRQQQQQMMQFPGGGPPPPYPPQSQLDRYVDGVDLLKMAASVTRSRLVIYDLPRNTNKTSLGKAALAAGYRGNIKLEEHYLNGRLKTVTAYLGSDFSSLLSQ